MLKAEKTRVSRKHSQNPPGRDLAYLCDSKRRNSMPELKKLTSKDSIETEDEHEDKSEPKDTPELVSAYLDAIECAAIKDFVEQEIEEVDTQLPYY